MTSLTVRDMMSSPLVTIPATMRLPQIKQVMREHHIRRLPVVEHGRLAGMISVGDLHSAVSSDATALSVYELSYLLNEITAAEIMRTDIVTIDAAAPLALAAQLMLDHAIGSLVVTEHVHPVGMITESDLFRAVIADNEPLPTAPPVVIGARLVSSELPIG